MYERFTSKVIKKLSEDRYLCTIPEANSREAVVDFGNGKKQLVRLSSAVPGTFQEYQHLNRMLVIEGDEIVGWFFIGKVKATSEVLKHVVHETGEYWARCPLCGGDREYTGGMLWVCSECGAVLGAEY